MLCVRQQQSNFRHSGTFCLQARGGQLNHDVAFSDDNSEKVLVPTMNHILFDIF